MSGMARSRFPESIWDDIVFGVLADWGQACGYIIENEGMSAQFDFFDGDYHFNAIRNGDELAVEWINGGRLPVVERTFTASAREFFSSYIAEVDVVFAEFAKLGRPDPSSDYETGCVKACIASRATIGEYLERALGQ